ncbi:MAG: CotH kinase family protein, partial [Clostridia bacterium]|nr:CotH kinase family protein [Clostridia bacterium]
MKRVTRITALLLALCLLAAGCTRPTSGDVAENPFVGDVLEKEEKVDINEVGLRDRKLLYANQDPTEVVTMYLTVMQGNEAEGTNHTWEEVNTYSAYDYDEWGVERYQVAGLLQIGDGKGGLDADEVGYGQVAPNCTVQIRGQSSSRNAQKNYKIRIKDNKGTWRGQQTIALNKHQSDGVRFRNKLGFDLLS